MAKANTERMIYKRAAEDGTFDAMALLPLHVIGPLMCENHDQFWSWQNCMKLMLKGETYGKSEGGRMLWNITDVRDCGRAHRLCCESTVAGNGSRYILSAADRDGELYTWQLQAMLQKLYPQVPEIGGEEMDGDKVAKPTRDAPRSYCLLAKQELGLTTSPIEDTIRATIDSYYQLGLL